MEGETKNFSSPNKRQRLLEPINNEEDSICDNNKNKTEIIIKTASNQTATKNENENANENENKNVNNTNEIATKFQKDITLEYLRNKMSQFANERDWNQFHTPRNLLLALVGEVGELCEIFQWREKVTLGVPELNDEEKIHLGEELADVLLFLIRLSDQCNIDLPAATLDKMQKNAKKYPAHLAKGSSAKYTTYMHLKQQSRINNDKNNGNNDNNNNNIINGNNSDNNNNNNNDNHIVNNNNNNSDNGNCGGK